MLTPKNREELETDGVTVVTGVISPEQCDQHQQSYRKWLGTFPEGEFPYSSRSLIHLYHTSQMATTWDVRLAAKPVFAEVWGTDRLLTSMDAIAIGRPPEEGHEEFWAPGQSWLHVDQSSDRIGLHAYQGAVYLEDCAEDDWTLEVIKGTHKYFEEFREKAGDFDRINLKDKDKEWYKERCPQLARVACPKGSLVLWDSRLVHANARPVKGRKNPGRWRFAVFVCMAPASWAGTSDLDDKRKAYEDLKATFHWPSQGCTTFTLKLTENMTTKDPNPMTELPEIAKTDEVKRLVGILPYDMNDGKPEPDFRPVWETNHLSSFFISNLFSTFRCKVYAWYAYFRR